jgi:hypothetical protein
MIDGHELRFSGHFANISNDSETIVPAFRPTILPF